MQIEFCDASDQSESSCDEQFRGIGNGRRRRAAALLILKGECNGRVECPNDAGRLAARQAREQVCLHVIGLLARIVVARSGLLTAGRRLMTMTLQVQADARQQLNRRQQQRRRLLVLMINEEIRLYERLTVARDALY